MLETKFYSAYKPQSAQTIIGVELTYSVIEFNPIVFSDVAIDPFSKKMDTKEFEKKIVTKRFEVLVNDEIVFSSNKNELMIYLAKEFRYKLAKEGLDQYIIKHVVDKLTNIASTSNPFYMAGKYSLGGIVNSSGTHASWQPLGDGFNEYDSIQMDQFSRRLPGAYENVTYPCDCPAKHFDVKTNSYSDVPGPVQGKLRGAIIHMNDKHKWSREAIADWLDELHDSGQVDIVFKVEVGGEE